MPFLKPSEKKQEQLAEEIKQIRKSNKANLVCADCPNRAPSYVCINFGTFVCTECSGLHRKFNHRVKSIAVATFTEDEVEKLRQGGNEVANAHYLAKYKRGHDTFIIPKEGERDRMEQYLTYKYIDKKWYKDDLKAQKKRPKRSKKPNKKDTEGSKSDKVEGGESGDTPPSRTVRHDHASNTNRRTSLKLPKDNSSSSDSNGTHSNTTPLLTTHDAESNQKEITPLENTDTGEEIQDQRQDENENEMQNWDPWGEDTTNTAEGSNSIDFIAAQNDWDDFWSNTPSNNNTQTSTTNGTAKTTVKKNNPNPTSLYQNPNSSMGNGFSTPLLPGGVPMGMGMPMAIPMWNTMNPTIPYGVLSSQSGSQMPSSNAFFGAFNQINPQQRSDEKKKPQDEEAQRQKETLQQPQNSNPEKDAIDPFASLLNDINLNLNLNSTTGQNSSDSQNRDKYKAPNVGANPNTFANNNPAYYGSMVPTQLPVNPYMAGPMPYMVPMGFMYPNPNTNANMYGYFPKPGPQTQPPNFPNNDLNRPISTPAVDDNPFR